MTNAIEKWFSAELKRCGFLEKYPFYTYILGRFELKDSDDVAVMAVAGTGGQPMLHINRDYFGDSSCYLSGVLLHEIHHVVLGHLSDPRFRTASDPGAMRIAMEISANEDVREPLPGRPIRHEQFSHLGIEPGQSTWERYELIAASMNDGPSDFAQTLLDEGSCRCIGPESDEIGAPSVGAIDTGTITDLLQAIDDDRPGASGLIAGRTAGELLTALSEISPSGHPSLDWKTLLRQFARSAGDRKHSYARPNRRFVNRIGEVPGKTRRHADGRKMLLAVVDTSSSMTTATVSEIFAELKILQRYAELTIVECDTIIQRVYPISQISRSIQGRGGTDLRPPFEAGVLRKHRPSGIVYFTDGAGPYPPEAPPVPTIWVLTGSERFVCPWGKQVRMGVGRRMREFRLRTNS